MGSESWQFDLTRPLWLAAFAVLPALVYYWRRTLVHFPPRQRAVSLLARILLVALVIGALAGPQFTGVSDRVQVLAVVDHSLSVSTQASKQKVAEFRDEAMKQGFGDQFTALWFSRETGELRFADEDWAEGIAADRRATDIASAILAARAAIPANRVGHILLLSDGNPTTGNTLAAAEAAGVPVSTVPLTPCNPEVCVAEVIAPGHVRQGESFHVEAVIESTHEDEATLHLLHGPDVVLSERKRLAKGKNRIALAQIAPEAAAVVFTVRIEGCKDTLAENNQSGCVVQVGPKPRVLLVESQPVLAEALATALKKQSVEVEIRGPSDLPGRTQDLRRYDLLVLSNVPATLLPAERMREIQQYVREGGGLIVVGGNQSLTAGGYRGTPLEEALPVLSEANRKKPKPVLAMALVLDCSDSMKEKSIELAREAARRAAEVLDPRDQIGILAFDDRSRWIVPLGPATDKARILKQIETIQAVGGTNMYPAMDRAHLALRDAFADLKHMIVLSDGISAPGDYETLAKSIAADGITVSTVGLGREPARPLLEGIAAEAKGQSYFVRDAAALPEIFALETASAGRIGINEDPFFPQVVHEAQAMRGLDFSKVPTLLGYVETQARPESQVALKSSAGDPVLAWWRYGRGTSVAFTSDIQSRWAAAWLHWPGFGQFWVQLVRQAMRKEEPANCALRVDRAAGDAMAVILDASDSQGKFLNGCSAVLTVTAPEGTATEVPLAQVAPGRYAARLAATALGTYHLETRLLHEGRPVDVPRSGFVASYPEELRAGPINMELLKAIADVSGGMLNPRPAEVFSCAGRTVPATWPLWPWLLLAAVLVFLLDLTLKRVEWRR